MYGSARVSTVGTLLDVLLLPLSSAMDKGEFDYGGGSGGSGGPMAMAAAVVVAVDNRDWWWRRLMTAKALYQGQTQQPTNAARGWHNKRTKGWCKGRQHNNQLIFRHATTTICGIVICCATTALPGIIVCHAATAICSIAFCRAAMAIGNIVIICLTT